MQDVRTTVSRAADKGQVPVLVIYIVPGRDCSQYSAGGAPTEDAYKAWIDGFAAGLSSYTAVLLLEPDGLALLPSGCGRPNTYDRVGLIQYAAQKLTSSDPTASVYLDAGHSAWHSVGDMTARIVSGGVKDVQTSLTIVRRTMRSNLTRGSPSASQLRTILRRGLEAWSL
jgi:endoglucanase